MNPIGARKCHSFIAISQLPDVCLTPCGNVMEPVPYAIIGRLDSSQGTVASVRANGEPVFVLDASTVPAVTGNEAGEGGGVNSGVCMGSVRATTASSSVRANGKFLVRHGDSCEMNIGPTDIANTYGIITNEAMGAPQGRIVDGEAENCAESETSDETECESFDPEPDQVAAVGQPEPNAHLQALIDKANDERSLWDKIKNYPLLDKLKGQLGVEKSFPGTVVKDPNSFLSGGIKGLVNMPADVANFVNFCAKFVNFSWSALVDEGLVLSTAGYASKLKDMAISAYKAGDIAKANALASKAGNLMSDPFQPLPLHNEAEQIGASMASVVPVGAALNKGVRFIKTPPPKPKTSNPAHQQAAARTISTTGDPVNAVTGEVVLTQSDFSQPGRIPLDWTRRYGSNAAYNGLLGPGWQTPADARLVLEDNLVVFYDGDTSAAVFDKLPGETPVMEAANGATLATIAEGWQVTLKSGMRYQFCQPLVNDNDQTLVVRISDSFGNSLSFVRDDGQLSAIVDSSGRRIAITCEDGRIAQMRHQDRLLVRYEYRKGRLVAAVDPTGHTRRYDYDNGRLIMHRNRNQLCFRYHYDAQGRCTRAFGDKGLYDYRFEYLPLEPCTRVTDSLGHVWHYYRDDYNLPTKVVDPNGAATLYDFDENTRLVTVTDPLERTTRYDYDAAGNVVKITRPDQSTLRFVYNAQNRPIEITDPGGGFITQRFDDHGQLIEKSGLLGHATRYQYSPGGDLIAITDPLERTTRFEWDKHGQLAGITRPSGNCTHYQYDPAGCLTAVIDPDGSAFKYSYDEKGRLVAAVSPGGLRRGFEYDAEDNLLLYTDAAGHQTRFAYSGLNKLSRRTNADGTHIEYHYDSEERLTGLTNEKGQTYGFAHDPAGRILARTDFYGQTHHYTFDPAGQLIQSTDPLQKTIAYTYDRLGRLTQKRFADERCETFTRDPSGRLTAFESPDIRIQRYHDGQGRLICEYSEDFSVKYDYDPAGQCIARGTSLGNSVKYEYDPDGNVQSIAINDAAPVLIQRDRLGRITGEQLSARFLRTRGYDEEGRLTTQRIESPLVHIDRAYSYDLTGNLIEKQDSAKGTHKFGYDPMGRITAALDPMKKVHRFSYDPAGDLLNHLPENQTDLRRATYQGGAYHFDAAGNLTRRQLNGATLDLSWDEQNRLRAVEGPDTQPVTMGYDALGRRCHKTVGDRQTLFVWDGDALIAESINHQKTREYVYYPGTFEPFAVIDADKQLYYYHNDINGLPQELTCPEGRIVWSARYDALGRLQGLRVDEVAQPLRLQGQYWDQEIGLCYNRYRYFDPHICSFISQDPIGLAGGENVYAYAPNVWGWVDPLGLCAADALMRKVIGKTNANLILKGKPAYTFSIKY
jgi:RHS repeat-associated protein